MREAVVVLAPHVRGEEIVERRDRLPPRNAARDLQPLRVLIEHRVDDVDERLVAREQAVAAGQEVALEPSLADVLRQDLHHAPVGRETLVERERSPTHARPVTSNTASSRFDAVSSGPNRRKLRASALRRKTSRRYCRARASPRSSPPPGCGTSTANVAEVGEVEVAQELPAVRVRARAHALRRARSERADRRDRAAVVVEELLRPVGPHPALESGEVLRVLARARERHLVRAPRALDRDSVDLLGPRPALRRAQDDHRPARALARAVLARLALEPADLCVGLVDRRRQRLMHTRGIVAATKIARCP